MRLYIEQIWIMDEARADLVRSISSNDIAHADLKNFPHTLSVTATPGHFFFWANHEYYRVGEGFSGPSSQLSQIVRKLFQIHRRLDNEHQEIGD